MLDAKHRHEQETIHMIGANSVTMTRAGLAGLVLVWSFSAPGCAGGDEASTTTLATFDAAAGEHPENADWNRSSGLWITLHRSMRVWNRRADGTTETFQLPRPDGVESRANGVVATDDGALVVVRSQDPAIAGIWELATGSAPRRRLAIPTEVSANGMAADPEGRLYVADDTHGVVWRADLAAGEWASWLEAEILAPEQPGGYGANGIHFADGALTISVPARGRVMRVAVEGELPGELVT
jgi:sugar lactone lactonase YvrE